MPEIVREAGKLVFKKSGMEGDWNGLLEEGDLFRENAGDVENAGDMENAGDVGSVGSAGELNISADQKAVGGWAYYGCAKLRRIIFPDKILTLKKSCFEKCSGLTEADFYADRICERAFAWCKGLKRVKIHTVSVIEKEAFLGCESLECFEFPDNAKVGEYAFSMCSSLKKIIVGKNVFFDHFVFCDCGNLREIVFADYESMTGLMRSSAFYGCTALETVEIDGKRYRLNGYHTLFDNALPSKIRQVYASACSVFDIEDKKITAYHGYADRVTIPEGIVCIGREVFRDREGLQEICIAKSVEDIGPRAFDKTEWLRKKRKETPFVTWKNILLDGAACRGSVVIPPEIIKISGWAFANNMALTELTFTKEILVEEFAFRNCIYLDKITLEDGIYTLGHLRDTEQGPELVRRIAGECYNCFKTDGTILTECTGNIERLRLPKGITQIGAGVWKESNLLTEISFNGEVKQVGRDAFSKCKWLKRAEHMESVEEIGKGAFLGCIRLEDVGDLKSLKILGERAFENCISLREIRLPEGIREIPGRAFYRCRSLERVVIPSTVERIAEDAFLYCGAKIIY